MTFSWVGVSYDAPRVSSDRMAYPSIPVLGSGGISKVEYKSSASVSPSASERLIISDGSSEIESKIWFRASSTEIMSSGRIDRSPVFVEE